MMDWNRLLTDERLLPPGASHPTDQRSEFQRDHDRIVFSHAFRRLQGKTQVHPMPMNDHVHNRLTHSLEVSSVGRSLGEGVGRYLLQAGKLPERVAVADVGAVVQAACLAHDLGNPPFGHAGEYAIRDWYRQHVNLLQRVAALDDFRCFEGNAQGFRIVTTLETNAGAGGLRLTCATLAAFQKYPWQAAIGLQRAKGDSDKVKFGYFESEAEIFRRVFQLTGIPEISPGIHARHPLAYLVEAADDICYAIIDLEDGLELQILRLEEFEALLLPVCDAPTRNEWASVGKDPSLSQRQRAAWLRGKAMGFLIRAVVREFATNETHLLQGVQAGSLIERCEEAVRDCIRKSKDLAGAKIFTYTRKTEIEIGAYAALDGLLGAVTSAAAELADGGATTLSFKTRRIRDLIGPEGPQIGQTPVECHRRALDFVAGMTDAYATRLANQLRGGRAQ